MENPTADIEENNDNIAHHSSITTSSHQFYSKKHLHGHSRQATFFSLLQSLTQDLPVSESLSASLIIISSLQTLSLTVMEDVNDQPRVTQYASYFRIVPLLQELNSKLFYFSAIAIVSLILLIGFIIILFAFISPRNKSTEILKPYMYYFHYIIFIPFTELFMTIFTCEPPDDEEDHDWVWPIDEDVECYATTQVISMCFTAIPLIFSIFIGFISAFICSYSHPHNNDPLAHYPSNFQLLYTVLRLLLLVNLAFGVPHESLYFTSICLAGILIAYYASIIWVTCPYYNSSISVIFTSCALSLILVVTFTAISYVVEKYFEVALEGEDICMVCLILMACIGAKLGVLKRLRRLLAAKKLDSGEELDKLVHTLQAALITRMFSTDLEEDLIWGYVSSYQKRAHATEVNYKEIASSELLESKQQYLQSFLLEVFEKNKDLTANCTIRIQLAQFYIHAVPNLCKAYAKLVDAENSDPSFILSYFIYRCKMRIMSAIGTEMRKCAKKGGPPKFATVLEFEHRLEKLRKKVEEAGKIRMAFWGNLNGVPDLNIIRRLGLEIMQSSNVIERKWQTIFSLYSKHSDATLLYSTYLADLLGKQYEAIKLQRQNEDKSESGLREFTKDNIYSEKAVTIIISANSGSKGKILAVSGAVLSLLDYQKSQIIGKNISLVMPRIYAKVHSKCLHTYIRTGIELARHNSFPCFALHRSGYIVPVKLSKQLLCGVDVGMNFVGNLHINSELTDCDVIITNEKGKIEGMTESLAKLIGLTPRVIAESDICVQQFSYEILLIKDFPHFEGAIKVTLRFPKDYNDLLKKETLRQDTLVTKNSRPIFHNPKARGSVAITSAEEDDIQTSAHVKCKVFNLNYPGADLIIKVLQLPSLANLMKQKNQKKQKKANALTRNILFKPTLLQAMTKFRSLGQRIKEKMKTVEELKTLQESPQSTSRESGESILHKKESSKLEGLSIGNGAMQSRELTLVPSAGNQDSESNFQTAPATGKNIIEEDSSMSNSYVKEPQKQSSGSLIQLCQMRRRSKFLTNVFPLIIKKKKKLVKNAKHKLALSDSGSSNSTEKILKTIEGLRKMDFAKFFPASVKRLKLLFLFFALLLAGIMSFRLVIALTMNENFKIYPEMMMHHTYRMHTIYLAGEYARQLVLMKDQETLKINFLDEEYRCSLYKKILGSNWIDQELAAELPTLSNYTLIMLSKLIKSVDQLVVAQKYISDHMYIIGDENVDTINPPKAEIHSKKNKFNSTERYAKYYMPTIEGVVTFVSEIYAIIEMIKGGNKITQDNFSAYFIIKNTYDTFVTIFQYTRSAIAADATRAIDIQSRYSFYLLISLVIVLSLLILILIPSIKSIDSELSSTLLVLLKVNKQQVVEQIQKIEEYLLKLKFYCGGKLKTHEDFDDESAMESGGPNTPKLGHDETSPKSNNTGTHRSKKKRSLSYYLTHMQERYSDKEDEKEHKPEAAQPTNQQAIDDTDKLISQKNAGDIGKQETEKSSNNTESVNRRRNLSDTNYVMYKSNIILILILATIFSAIIFFIYFLYHFYSNKLGDIVNAAMEEFSNIAGNYARNGAELSAIYQLIGSQNKETCIKLPCSFVVQSYDSQRKNDINTMWLHHQQTEEDFPESYKAIFSEIMENDACSVLMERAGIANCQTTFGNILASGLHITNEYFVDIIHSFVGDLLYFIMYANTTSGKSLALGLNITDLRQFASDKRLILGEVLNYVLMDPAYEILEAEIRDSTTKEVNSMRSLAIAFFVVYALALLLLFCVGGRILVVRLRRSIFDTRSLLGHLHPDIVEANPEILAMLIERGREIRAEGS